MEISSVTPLNQQLKTESSQDNSFNLGKDDFLKLFMEGLKHQDPLNPMKNDEMMSQIAQLGFMEQVTKMSKSVEALQESVTGNQLQQGSAFIGKTITAFDGNNENPIVGVVQGVRKNDAENLIEFLLENDTVQLGQIKEVSLSRGDMNVKSDV
ncbi:hypothetical protein IMZ31_21050 (plasmid) [Pontibacillus sp. ALD_SL1]|uniref:flagellar hook assembly protein FlgD n=1 Tax=Pontibacillus sp. ALD_SL1 TaxID=2777185 RepID=UPI001A978B6D|nr:flagellar hook capping FlgD N-terminal domain-containing protein [Pontibacillus sp. ALD_SL1]QST03038.1 hypothetical protein IMZ31_21050 [Pontibacillus sp. ALD_SL1]